MAGCSVDAPWSDFMDIFCLTAHMNVRNDYVRSEMLIIEELPKLINCRTTS